MSMISFANGIVWETEVKKAQTLSEASASDDKPLTYTKTDINRMSKEKLVSIADENGIEGAQMMSGNALKQVLIDMLGI